MRKAKIVGLIALDIALTTILAACDMVKVIDSDTYYDLIIEGEGTTDPEPGNHEYEEFTNAEIKAIADDEWEFDYCEGDYPFGERSSEEISFLMTENRSITDNLTEISPGSKDYPATLNGYCSGKLYRSLATWGRGL